MRRSLRLPALLLFLALPFAGCDNEGLSLNGEYVATVSGDVAADLMGDAYYTVFEGADGPTFVLLFFRGNLTDNDEDAYTYVALWRDGTRPGTGVYPIESTNTTGNAFLGSYADLINAETPDAEGPVITATTGVLSITDFDTGQLTGSFRFDGRGLFLPDTDAFINASVNGTFEARFLSPSTVRSLPIDFDFD